MTHDHHHHDHHKAKFSHELIGGIAAYEAMKTYDEHRERHGEHVNHAKAKEIMAGLGGALLVREMETKGADALDRHRNHENHHHHHHHHHR